MRTRLLHVAIDTAARHQVALPATTPGLSGSGVSISVVVILSAGFAAWYMLKHKKVKPWPAMTFLALGLALSGTQIGVMIGTFLANFGQMLNQFIGSA